MGLVFFVGLGCKWARA
ncbi:hypothetical protein F383_07045 [Gossypium arboreum]|uniref:Uncharacterized protein n=1 Tax=Gossypium arboreum TaxID=29729 RepID=A0A0B0NT05_GOSAR|nr:hypothetical protein F383_07045 [Gossypium arboreum]